ncbi:hypothetical protein ONS95_002709 [Cadophora gregata]|uniref:uncharacterized protein n=1 Tax=Cadophora gregata TaxID=51156 RepID=UPI0026DC79D4|nr:uncharacterized protein ONS95_002709 [Cadophora gregata]KAK0110049.1 hypothetical protein ONS95_002709 [Cadophora gregata]KAK0110330.1 hypothetical protein ONS96_001946 [Cadophora gregata f. sp. sojae]
MHYSQCLHVRTQFRQCSSMMHYYPPRKHKSHYDRFCPQCLLLPDPRDSGLHRTEDGSRYRGPAARPRLPFDSSRQEAARRLWLQARAHIHDHPNDATVFVVPENDLNEPLPKLGRQMLAGIHLLLLYDFWKRLDGPDPCTMPQRMLIVQLQTALEYNECKERMTYRGPEKQPRTRNEIIADSLMGIGVEDIKNYDVCSICCSKLHPVTEDGTTEPPVKTKQCGHVFGENCIKSWLDTNSTCPRCWAEILKLQNHELYRHVTVLYENLLGDEHEESRARSDLGRPEDYSEDSELPGSEPSDNLTNSMTSRNALEELNSLNIAEYGEDDPAMPLWMRVLLCAREKRDCDFLFMGFTESQMKFMFDYRLRPEKREQVGDQRPKFKRMHRDSLRAILK